MPSRHLISPVAHSSQKNTPELKQWPKPEESVLEYLKWRIIGVESVSHNSAQYMPFYSGND